MKKLLLSALFMSFAICLARADDLPTIESLINKEYFVEDHWAGHSFTLIEKNDGLFVIWRVFGSGRPVVSEEEYAVVKKSSWQYRFNMGLEKQNEVKVGIFDQGEVRVFLNGIRIYAKENEHLTSQSTQCH